MYITVYRSLDLDSDYHLVARELQIWKRETEIDCQKSLDSSRTSIFL